MAYNVISCKKIKRNNYKLFTNLVHALYQISSQSLIITNYLLQEECENQYLPLFRFTTGNAAQVLDKNVRVSP